MVLLRGFFWWLPGRFFVFCFCPFFGRFLFVTPCKSLFLKTANFFPNWWTFFKFANFSQFANGKPPHILKISLLFFSRELKIYLLILPANLVDISPCFDIFFYGRVFVSLHRKAVSVCESHLLATQGKAIICEKNTRTSENSKAIRRSSFILTIWWALSLHPRRTSMSVCGSLSRAPKQELQ